MHMIEKSSVQLELFSQPKGTQTQGYASGNFLTFLKAYEKTILFVISFLIMGIVSFSLGVERGKKLSILKTNSQLDLVNNKQPALNHSTITIRPQQPRLPLENQEQTKPQGQPQENMQGYTIQLASFQANKYAQKEALALKKRGFFPLVLTKGKYSILCVGKFQNKETAKSVISKLKKNYQDCFIRRL